jgi:DNA-binding transcriptional LysR family regulator
MSADARKTNNEIEGLNLRFGTLRLLGALLETGSITQAGEQVGMSQPASSRAVAQLREVLGDSLVENGKLTPFALGMQSSVQHAISAFSAVFTPHQFDPENSQRTFRIAAGDYGTQTVLVPLIRHLAKTMPRVLIRIEGWSDDSFTMMEKGDLDCALYAGDKLPDGWQGHELFHDKMVLLSRIGHPIASVNPVERVVMNQGMTRYGYVVARQNDGIDEIAAPRIQLCQREIEFPSLLSAAMLVAATDRLMMLPEKGAQNLFRNFGLFITRLPASDITSNFGFKVIWHGRAQRDAGVQWLVEQMHEVLVLKKEPLSAFMR